MKASDEERAEISRRLRAARMYGGFKSVKKLADHIGDDRGFSKGALTNAETGNYVESIGPSKLRTIADACGVPLEFFYADFARLSEIVPTKKRDSADASTERSDLLRSILEQLPVDQREVLVLRHVAGLSPAEIAARLGKTEASIHGLHARARKALASALREGEDAPLDSSQRQLVVDAGQLIAGTGQRRGRASR